MTAKQQRFVAEYLIDLNATQAAIRSGYSRKTATEQGYRLLRNVHVAGAVQAGQAKVFQHADLRRERVLEEMRRLAFSDLRTLFGESGELRPIRDLTDEQAAAIASVEVTRTRTFKAGQTSVEEAIHKVRAWDKTRALEQLGKHFGILRDTLDIPAVADLAAQLARKVVHEVHPGPSKGA